MVAESNNTIVGGLILLFEDDYVSLANIAVHPEFQGHGLGKSLMELKKHEEAIKHLDAAIAGTDEGKDKMIYFFQFP